MLKRFIAVSVCVIIIITTLTASGCSLKQDTIEPAVTERVTNVYKTEYVSIPENYSYSGNIFIAADRIFTLCNEIIDKATYKTQTVLYSVDINGENPESKVVEQFLEDGFIQNYIVVDDGASIVVESKYDPDKMMQIYLITKVDKDGNIVFSINPQSLLSSDNDYLSIQSMVGDSAGNIYMSLNTQIIAISSSGEKLFDITVQGYIQTLSSIGERIVISYYDNTTYSVVSYEIDIAQKKLGNQINISGLSDIYSNNILLGNGFDYYIKNDEALYGYNSGDAEPTKLADWINSDVLSTDVNNIKVIDADTAVYVDIRYPSSYSSRDAIPARITFLTRVPDDEVVAKYIIRLATVSTYLPSSLNIVIIDFNKQSLTHRVVVDNYSRYDKDRFSSGESEGMKILSAEIAAGKIPDMLLDSSIIQLSDSLAAKGMFVDMYEFLDNDTELSRNDLLKCIRLPFEEDGKLYKLVTQFGISSFIGKTSNIKDYKDNWTLDSMIEFAKSLSEGIVLMGDATQQSMAMIFTIAGIDQFIDKNTGECKFDQQTFIDILEYAKTFPENSESYMRDNKYENHRNDKQMIDSLGLSSFSDYLQSKYAFGTDELSIIGFPGVSGDSGGALVSPMYSYSISAKSAPEVQEGAWELLKKVVLDESSIDSGYGYFNFPPTYSLLDKLAEKQKERGYRYYENGNYEPIQFHENPDGTISEIESYYILSGQSGQAEGTTMRLSDEDISIIKDYLETVTSSVAYDEQIISIIQEESMDFFAGTKTAEETAKIIQSRISIYVSESK